MRTLLGACALLLGLPVAFAALSSPPEQSISAGALRVVRLSGSADFLEVVGDSVFVTNEPRNLVHRLDSGTGTVQAEIAVGAPCGAMTVAGGGLWVASCEAKGLVRVDLRTNEVTARAATGLADAEGELMLAASEHGVFVASDQEGIVSLVDPVKAAITARIRVKPRSFALTAGFGALWVSNTGTGGAAGSVQRIDPAARRVVAEIPTGPEPRFLAAGEGSVWVLNQGDGSVTRIDPSTNRVVATIPVGVKETGGDIATGHGRVWVRGKKVLLSVVDPRSNGVVARFGPPAGSGAVRATADGVWVSAHDVNALWLIRP